MQNTSKIIGVKIYEYHGNYSALAAQWKDMGINTSFISTTLAANDTFRQALKRNNIPAFIIFPVFQNPEVLKQDSSLYAITNKGTKAKDDWDTFRCDLIATMVKELAEKARQIKPGLIVNIHVVPWREEDFGGANIRVAAQDLWKISTCADYISPMCYSQMLKRDAGWIANVVVDMDKRAPRMILPSIQVYPYYIDRPFTAEDFKRCVEEALKPPSRGVVFFSWPLFERDSLRMEVVREVVTGDSRLR
jgi:hypothetical protein